MEFLYDHTGVFAVKYNESTYFYRKNAQNNIIALLDNNGSVVVKYKYDAWGKCKALNGMVLKLRTITTSVFLTPSDIVVTTMTTVLDCTSLRQDTTILKLIVL